MITSVKSKKGLPHGKPFYWVNILRNIKTITAYLLIESYDDGSNV
jgi:hypothetical protein